MLNENQIRQWKKERLELISRIQTAEQYKKQLRIELELLEEQCQLGLLTFAEYEFHSRKLLKGKTPQEWTSYFDEEITNCKKRIAELNQKIHVQQVSYVPASMAILLFITIGAIALLQPQITGYFAAQPEQMINSSITLPINQFVTNDSFVEITFMNTSSSKPIAEMVNLTPEILGNQTGYTLTDLNIDLASFQLTAPKESGTYELTIAIKNLEKTYAITAMQIEVSSKLTENFIVPEIIPEQPPSQETPIQPETPEEIPPPAEKPVLPENLTLPKEIIPENITQPENFTLPQNITMPESNIISRLQERLSPFGLKLENAKVLNGKYTLEIVREPTKDYILVNNNLVKDYILVENITEDEIDELDMKSMWVILYAEE